MRALTVQQPWAWAIFNGKNIENRTALWSYRGPLAIHAGMRGSERGFRDRRILAAAGSSQQWHDLVYGAIIGLVYLVDVHPDAGCCRPWGESAYPEHGTDKIRRDIAHLVLDDPREFTEPIPCKGALGLWSPPADLEVRLALRLEDPPNVPHFDRQTHPRKASQ
jgi:hypothetical protein